MKKILSFILIVCVIASLITGISYMNTENVYARLDGEDNRQVYQPTDDPVFYYQPPVDESGNHDYFGYPMYDDPQDITDEEFFGKWDDVAGEWVLEPYFRYSDFPEMKLVEDAARAGDYAAAKEKILKYYKDVPNRGEKSSYNIPDAKIETYLEALSRNIFAYAYISSESIGGFELPAENWGKTEVDVLYEIKEARGSYTDFNVMVASGDKYWTTAQIYSNDASDPSVRPVLRLEVNGVVVEKPVTKDTMVVGGNQADINFAYDEIIQIQEHGTFDDIYGTYNSYDENTKRAFIAFDISDIKSSDVITEAKIVFTGRSIITEETRNKFADENGTPYSGNSRDKYMWALWYKSSAWEETELTWNSTIIADKHYFSCNDMNAWDFISSNSTTAKGKVCDYHRDGQIGSLRKAYLYYKDERFAYTFLRQEMAMLNSIGFEPEVMNSLDMSTHLTGLASGFYAMMSSEYMTPDVCTALLKYMWQLTNVQVETWFGYYTNNWATFATGAVYKSLAFFPEWSVHDYWYQRLLEENDRCLSGMTIEDGLCIELTHAYINTLLGTFSSPMSAYVITGHEPPYSEELYEDIYDIVKSLMYTSGPYFGGFNVGDSYDPYHSYKSLFRTWYQYLFGDDKELEWVITDGASGAMPENATTHYPIGLKTVMRSSWDKNSLQLSFINNSDIRASHYHNDVLSVAMFAYGKFLLVDPGYGSDQTSDNGRVWTYNMSPVQHNLVTVNDTYDYLTDGVVAATKLSRNSTSELAFESNKYYDYVEYACDGYSTAQNMQRSVTFLKNQKFWIVSDYAVPTDPSAENVFAQHWHMYPGANPTNDENYVVKSNFDDVNVMVVPVEYEDLDGVQFVDTYYAEQSGQKVLNKKAMYTKTKTGDGKFTTLIIPVNINEEFEVMARAISNKNEINDDILNMAYFKITEKVSGVTRYYYYYHINDELLKPADGIKLADYTTDATTMLIEQNEKEEIVSVFLVDGSYIKDSKIDGEYLFKNNSSTTLSFKRNGQFVNIMSSMLTDVQQLENISIYMPSTKAAMLDTKEVAIKNSDGVVTFEGTYGSNNVSSGGSGGGSGGGGAVTPKPPVVEDNKTEEDNKDDAVTPINPAVQSYNDVKECDWYFGYVEELTEKGIVSGDGTGKFNPNDNVTREQFLKMLIEASGIDAEETENSFADVKDMWYKPYVLKAKGFGIVNGVSDTKFGIGANITRQDMAVMISRVIEKLGTETEKTDAEVFADSDKVSDYAKDAVIFMKSIGLIEGYNNEYRPLDNLTRAEAAKVIYELLNIIK